MVQVPSATPSRSHGGVAVATALAPARQTRVVRGRRAALHEPLARARLPWVGHAGHETALQRLAGAGRNVDQAVGQQLCARRSPPGREVEPAQRREAVAARLDVVEGGRPQARVAVARQTVERGQQLSQSAAADALVHQGEHAGERGHAGAGAADDRLLLVLHDDVARTVGARRQGEIRDRPAREAPDPELERRPAEHRADAAAPCPAQVVPRALASVSRGRERLRVEERIERRAADGDAVRRGGQRVHRHHVGDGRTVRGAGVAGGDQHRLPLQVRHPVEGIEQLGRGARGERLAEAEAERDHVADAVVHRLHQRLGNVPGARADDDLERRARCQGRGPLHVEQHLRALDRVGEDPGVGGAGHHPAVAAARPRRSAA